MIVATKPTIASNFTILKAPRKILRWTSNILPIFYEVSPSGLNFSSINKFANPHSMDNPLMLAINTIRATEPIGANPSGVEDSNMR